MKRLLFTCLLASSSIASADVPSGPIPNTPNDLINPTSIVEGEGIKVGEGTVLHPIFGIETGYVSNVFYEAVGASQSAIARALIEVQAGTLSPERLQLQNEQATDPAQQSMEQGSLQYDLRAYATWDQYLSTNSEIQDQGGLGGGLLFRGIVNPMATWNFAFMEWGERLIRPTNFESSSNTNRDINTLNLRVNYQPYGLRFSGYAYYQNVVDLFEKDTQHFANQFQNLVGVHVNWQWLPLTRLFTELSQGVFTGIDDSQKVTSFPFMWVVGIMTNLTLNTTFTGRIGYTQGFYQSGPDYATVVGGAQLGYRYSPMGRITVMYSYDHVDSINANFYADHGFYASLDQMLGQFAIAIRPEMHFRSYDGVPAILMPSSTTRDDFIFALTVGARYVFKDNFAATLDYNFTTIQTDFRYMADGLTIDPSYNRHQLLAGLRYAY